MYLIFHKVFSPKRFKLKFLTCDEIKDQQLNNKLKKTMETVSHNTTILFEKSEVYYKDFTTWLLL